MVTTLSDEKGASGFWRWFGPPKQGPMKTDLKM
jgi:hypothetical protein